MFIIHRLWTSSGLISDANEGRQQPLILQVVGNQFRGRFTTETQGEHRLEIQRQRRRLKPKSTTRKHGREHRLPVIA